MAKLLIKNGQNGCFLKKIMAKITQCFNYGNFIGVSNCSEGSICFAEKMWSCQRSKFVP